MFDSARLSLLIINAVGAGVVAAGVFGVAWLTVIRDDDPVAEIRKWEATIRDARQDLTHLQKTRAEQDVLLAKNRANLEECGRLPEQTPIEDYFQTLATLTAQHHLRVLRQNPIAARQYPGVFEERYAYVLAGTMPDLMRFLWAIEQTDFWADVGYIKIENGPGRGPDGSSDRVAELTLSLFSAVPVESPTNDG